MAAGGTGGRSAIGRRWRCRRHGRRAPPAAPPGTGGVGAPGSTLPPIDDYSKNGPFMPMTMTGSGPDGAYTMVRPATLGENGFKHPVATWGNGITTTPALYPGLLNAIASHGFVIIASDSSTVTAAMMTQGSSG